MKYIVCYQNIKFKSPSVSCKSHYIIITDGNYFNHQKLINPTKFDQSFLRRVLIEKSGDKIWNSFQLLIEKIKVMYDNKSNFGPPIGRNTI